MSTSRTLAVVAAATALVGVGAVAYAANDPAPTRTASATLAADLRTMAEEERMARDLYAALAAAHDDARPMSMVTRSEQRHVDAVDSLLETYGVADPAEGLAAGTYAVPEIQKLYDAWLAQGRTSLDAAYQVGIELEKRDIADLDAVMARTSASDVDAVLARLRAASEHHLAAYTAAKDGTFTPGQGSGMGGGQGRGMGQGMGYGQGNGMGQGAGRHGGTCPMSDAS